MCGFDSLYIQGVAQHTRHSLRVTELRMRAPFHRRTETIGACIADSFANDEGAEELIRLLFPKGAGGGCIYRFASMENDYIVNQKNAVGAEPLNLSTAKAASGKRVGSVPGQ